MTALRPRVLVVEDSATQAAALAGLLEENGYDVLVTRNGEQALELLPHTSVDLVLSDIMMPGLSGYDVCRRIKSELGMRELPVVLLTGLSDPLDIVRGLECGADNYITKPYDPAHLLARVAQVFENRRLREGTRPGQGVEITFLGQRFTITADKEQILDLLVSSYEELVRTNQAVRAAEQRSRFLADASGALATSLDATTILGNLARMAVPMLGDLCVADTIDDDGMSGARVEVASAQPRLAEAARWLTDRAPDLDDRALVGYVVRERTALLLERLDDAAVRRASPGAAALDALYERGVRSLLAVPLVARGHSRGALIFCAGDERRPYGVEDLALAQELARQTALAVDNARLYREAQLATRARDDVLAIVSHDLRNPIHAIYMAASFLSEVLPKGEEPTAVTQRKQALTIRRAAQRANGLIGDLLDVTRIEAGRLTVSATPRAAADLVADVITEMTTLAEEKQVQLVAQVAEVLPSVLADRARVAQVLSNLMGNAIKFTPARGVVTIAASGVDGHVRFTVTDTGPGIPAENLAHLFDRYWQAQETKELGTGLGLFIAKGIVEAHSGQMWVESEIGRGSSFHFTLPIIDAPPDIASADARESLEAADARERGITDDEDPS
jgi:signal transduction histidine kinase